MRRLAVAGAMALSLALAACGGSPPTRPVRALHPPAQLAAVVLGFWHAVYARRYRAAYRYLGPSARTTLPFRRFRARAAYARPVFTRTPRIAFVQGKGKVRTVYVASSRDGLTRADAVQVVFTVRRYPAGWRIAAPPFRKTAAARGRRRGTRRAPRPAGSRARPRA